MLLHNKEYLLDINDIKINRLCFYSRPDYNINPYTNPFVERWDDEPVKIFGPDTICIGSKSVEFYVSLGADGKNPKNYGYNIDWIISEDSGIYIEDMYSNKIFLNFYNCPPTITISCMVFNNVQWQTRTITLTLVQPDITYNIDYYDNQTLSIQTETLKDDIFDLDKYIDCDFDYFDYFFKNTRYVDNDGNYEQTTHFSIFNNGDDYIQSSTLFKGIKYNVHKISNIIRDDNTNQITQYISDNTKNYNGYKFSVILNTIYNTGATYLDEDFAYLLKKLPAKGVKSKNDLIGNKNSLHIFTNDKYKNILIIINIKLDAINKNVLTLNNVEYFEQREGMYYNKSRGNLNKSYNLYDPNVILSYNFISSINSLNNKNLFEDYATFYYIGEKNDNKRFDFGYAKVNDDVNNLHGDSYYLRNMTSWSNDFPPMKIECELPELINTKKNSYIVASIKGPKFNIYDKYKTDYNEVIYDRSFIKEPLSRYIYINEKEIKPRATFTKELEYNNSVYRYNGPYEPIFKNVELFSPISYNIINGGYFSQKKYPNSVTDVATGTTVNQTNILELKSVKIIDKKFLLNKISYCETKIREIDNDIQFGIYNDIDMNNNLQNRKSYYTDLYELTKTQHDLNDVQIGILSNYQENPIPNPISTTPSWIFKDKSLGVCNGDYTTCELSLLVNEEYKYSNILKISNFDFSIPLDSTINGISVDIRKYAKIGDGPTLYSAIADNEITITKPDMITNSENKGILLNNKVLTNPLNLSSYWSTGITTMTYGGDEDLWGLSGLTAQDINNNNFTLNISVTALKNQGGGLVNIAYIDCVGMTIYYTINSLQTGYTYTSTIERNTKFDTGLKNFGEVSELIISKVNEKVNPLKIKMTNEDRSIYPMVDEFGYSWNNRFIFKSSWDNDYYIRTKNEIE